MTGDKPKDWVNWLTHAEYWYNTHFHTAIGTTPYEVDYGQSPKDTVNYSKGASKVDMVDRSLAAREEALSMLKFHLRRAQDRMKHYADLHRTERQFAVGDWVYVKLQPYRQVTLWVFHVSQLKLHKGQTPTKVGDIPVTNQEGLLIAEPHKVLARCLMKKGNAASVAVLVQWKGESEEDATWEPIDDIQLHFPDFNLL
ncbi:uncharacterized protein [Rutidosis leptorrhynchoides]|uniref:uncharacterized protein n=1 Tax=Rutidosis leptorrhynchoides TaxID=125765 RepID=UPI003A99E88B